MTIVQLQMAKYVSCLQYRSKIREPSNTFENKSKAFLQTSFFSMRLSFVILFRTFELCF